MSHQMEPCLQPGPTSHCILNTSTILSKLDRVFSDPLFPLHLPGLLGALPCSCFHSSLPLPVATEMQPKSRALMALTMLFL